MKLADKLSKDTDHALLGHCSSYCSCAKAPKQSFTNFTYSLFFTVMIVLCLNCMQVLVCSPARVFICGWYVQTLKTAVPGSIKVWSYNSKMSGLYVAAITVIASL